MARINPYDVGLEKNAANYTPLSPPSLLARTAYTYPRRVAVIHGERQLTWAEVYARCRARLAHFKAPKRVVFGPLPRTSTGKIQKYVLRDQVKSASAINT